MVLCSATPEVLRKATVRVLLKAGADIDHAAEGGATPLHFAASEGDDATVRLLWAQPWDFVLYVAVLMTPLMTPHSKIRNVRPSAKASPACSTSTFFLSNWVVAPTTPGASLPQSQK